MVYDKICTNCGKPFQTERHGKRVCSKECLCDIRRKCAQKRKKTGVWAGKPIPKEIVKIKITEPIDVFEHLRPEVGSVHEAESIPTSKFAPTKIYIIRNIGKYGLVVRGNECEELGGV